MSFTLALRSTKPFKHSKRVLISVALLLNFSIYCFTSPATKSKYGSYKIDLLPHTCNRCLFHIEYVAGSLPSGLSPDKSLNYQIFGLPGNVRCALLPCCYRAPCLQKIGVCWVVRHLRYVCVLCCCVYIYIKIYHLKQLTAEIVVMLQQLVSNYSLIRF